MTEEQRTKKGTTNAQSCINADALEFKLSDLRIIVSSSTRHSYILWMYTKKGLGQINNVRRFVFRKFKES